MSIELELSRLQTNRNTIRAKLVELGMANNTDKLDTLPLSLEEALECAAGSEFVSRHIPERILKEYSL